MSEQRSRLDKNLGAGYGNAENLPSAPACGTGMLGKAGLPPRLCPRPPAFGRTFPGIPALACPPPRQ